MRRLLPRLLLAVASAASCNPDAAPVADLGDDTPRGPIDSDKAIVANGGGCYPQGIMRGGVAAMFSQLGAINPHWAPVVPAGDRGSPRANPVVMHGIAHASHGDTGGDFPPDHEYSDATV